MTYHLFFAARWVQEGGFTLFSIPGGVDGYSHFPINGEIMAAWYMLPFHSDLAANISNFPAWILGIFAVYAFARECELSSDSSVLASLLVCFSPMLFELLPTSYVDILVFSSLISATLFFLKYEKTAELKYVFVSGLASGIAIGTKLSALYYILILLAFVLLKSVFFLKEKKISFAGLSRALILSVLLAGSVGAYQYCANFLETGNPLYPFAFGSFEASQYKQKVIDEILAKVARANMEVGFFSGFLRAFEIEGKANFWAGNRKFFLFLLLSIFSIYNLKSTKQRFKNFSLLVLGLLPVYLIFAAESPDVVTTRMVWPHLSARLMASSLVVLTILAIKISFRSFFARAIQLFFALLVFIDLSNIVWAQSHLLNVIIIYFELFVLSAIVYKAILVNSSRSSLLDFRSITGLTFSILLLSFMTFHLEYFRSKTQQESYSKYKDDFAMPIPFRHGWTWLLAQPGQKTIAFATGWWQYGHNWFFFPLLGRKFENRVVYASINRTSDLPTSVDSGLLRETASKEIWLANLKNKKVDYLYLQTPETYEHLWARENPNIFKEVFSDKVAKVYRINW